MKQQHPAKRGQMILYVVLLAAVVAFMVALSMCDKPVPDSDEQPSGGDNARMVRAWLDWQLKGKQEHEPLFIGGDLKDYPNWTIEHKNFK